MEGVVRLVNQETDLFAVETDDGFTVLETADIDDVEIGDEIVGDLGTTTCEVVLSKVKVQYMNVHVRRIVATLTAAEALLFDE